MPPHANTNVNITLPIQAIQPPVIQQITIPSVEEMQDTIVYQANMIRQLQERISELEKD